MTARRWPRALTAVLALSACDGGPEVVVVKVPPGAVEAPDGPRATGSLLNGCGGAAALGRTPGSACGEEDGCASWTCDGPDALRCARMLGLGCPAYVDGTIEAGLDPNPDGLGSWGGGVAASDLDGDGALDIVRSGPAGACAYLGDGAGAFADATVPLGLDGVSFAHAVVLADYDADGWVDLVGTSYLPGPSLRILRGGAAGFSGAPMPSSAVALRYLTGVAWADYDADGDLDLYVAERADDRVSALLRNDGGELVDVTMEAGVANAGGLDFQGSWLDFDLDGDMDLVTCNDKASIGFPPNALYRNESDGTFTDVAEVAGVAWPIDCMGIGIGDYDDDGDPDLYFANVSDTPVAGVDNLLLQNGGDGTFDERAVAAGVGLGRLSWGAQWLDHDLDGDLDLLVSSDGLLDGPSLALYDNLGDGTFADVTLERGLSLVGSTFGIVAVDPDRDGDLDLAVMSNRLEGALVYYRHLGAAGHWLEVSLVAGAWNPAAIGAKVSARLPGGRTMTRWVESGGSYMSSGAPEVHFGLGAASSVSRLEVTWPDGAITTLESVAADQLLTIVR